MKKLLAITILCFSLLSITNNSLAGSDVTFPANWNEWVSVNTVLTGIGALPGCDADVSSLPQIYQETVATYCAVKVGGPGKVAVLINPGALDSYKARNGKFSDGPNLILHLKDMKVLFVTGHKGGVANYGVFTEGGKDAAASEGPLSTSTCLGCHTGYQAFCKNGQCGKVTK